jgi:hypothetical protein
VRLLVVAVPVRLITDRLTGDRVDPLAVPEDRQQVAGAAGVVRQVGVRVGELLDDLVGDDDLERLRREAAQDREPLVQQPRRRGRTLDTGESSLGADEHPQRRRPAAQRRRDLQREQHLERLLPPAERAGDIVGGLRELLRDGDGAHDVRLQLPLRAGVLREVVGPLLGAADEPVHLRQQRPDRVADRFLIVSRSRVHGVTSATAFAVPP